MESTTIQKIYSTIANREGFEIYCRISQEGIFILDKKGKILSANSVLLKMLEFENDNLIDRFFFELVYLEDHKKFNEFMLSVNANPTHALELECRLLKKNKLAKIWANLRLSVYKESESEIFYLGTVRDISKAKDLEVQLRVREDEFRVMIEKIPDLFYRTDEKGYLTFISPSVLTHLGYTVEEVIGTPITDYYENPNERAKILEVLRAAQGKPALVEAAFRHKTGRRAWMSTHAFMRFDQNGKYVGVEGITRDISEKKNLEMQLRESQERAEQANRAKGAFLSTMSHEVRTPMNVILGLTEILDRTPLNEAQLKYVRRLKSASKVLLEMIDQVLDLSKVDGGQLVLRPEIIDINKLINDIAELMAVKSDEKGLSFSFEIEKDLPRYLELDPKRLKQILINLIGNAIKYTEKGFVKLKARPMMSENGKTLVCEVEDSGIGIEKKDYEKIFMPFNQLKTNGENKEGGVGLGLAIATKLCDLMSGKIEVKSEIGKGSIFKIVIPFSPVDEEYEKEITQPKIEPKLSGYRVLIVEDLEDNRFLMEVYLQDCNCEYEFAFDGVDAVEKCAKTQYDMIFMDIHMPKMNGLEATQKIRDLEKIMERPPVPIVALTAYAIEQELTEALRVGCTTYLTKPVRKNDLFEIISSQYLQTNANLKK